MDFKYKIYLKKAQNEINLAKIIMKLSTNKNIQLEIFEIEEKDTYFSAVITHAYYCIFHATKAYLLTKKIKTKAPEEHKKTFEEFKKIIEKGQLDFELLKIYKEIIIKADTLLHIFKLEKRKRGNFTYKTLPQANKEPAQESLNHAKTFFKHIYNTCEQ